MRYSAPEYAKALYDLSVETPAAKRREMVREFIAFVSKNGGLSLLPEIMREFESASDKEAGIHTVVVRAPERLVESVIEKKLPFKGKVRALRDASLEGGAMIEVDDLRIDNSIAMRFQRMRETLTR